MKANRTTTNLSRQRRSSTAKKESITLLYVSGQFFGIRIPFSLNTSSIKNYIQKKFYADWNKQFKVWQVNVLHYSNCCKYFQQISKDELDGAKINKIPEFVYNTIRQLPPELKIESHPSYTSNLVYYQDEKNNQISLPFYDRLHNFQKQVVSIGVRKHGRLLIADQVGLGKTIQAISIVTVYRKQWPFLVICPSHLKENWSNQITNWLGRYIKKQEIQISERYDDPIKKGIKTLIMSYDVASKKVEKLNMFHIVIADQAHYLKNRRIKRTDSLIPYLMSRKRVILLTAVPGLNRPHEIYNLLSIIRPDVYYDFQCFANRYCNSRVSQFYRIEYDGCQNITELLTIIQNNIMVRRTKIQVINQLPDKQRQKIYVYTEKNVINNINKLLSYSEDDENYENQGNIINKTIYTLSQHGNKQSEVKYAKKNRVKDDINNTLQAYVQTGQAKLQAVKEYIIQLLRKGGKTLIFAHRMKMLDEIANALEQNNIGYIRIDGNVKKQKQHQAVTIFQDNPSITAAILSITAAGVGLNMSAASVVVFAELHWDSRMMVQAEDRAHTAGQKSSINCHYLLGKDSLLDNILYKNFEQSKELNVQKNNPFEIGKYEWELSSFQQEKLQIEQNKSSDQFDREMMEAESNFWCKFIQDNANEISKYSQEQLKAKSKEWMKSMKGARKQHQELRERKLMLESKEQQLMEKELRLESKERELKERQLRERKLEQQDKSYSEKSQTQSSICFSCKKSGHMSFNCSQRNKCHNCNEYGHYKANCPNITCYICNRKGHYSYGCPNNNNEGRSNQFSRKGNSRSRSEDDGY